MTAPQDRIEELRAILAELSALGEPPPEDMEAELRQAEALQATLTATIQGSHSLQAMPLPSDDDLDALQDPLRAMHRIRAAAGADTLRPLDQRRLLKGIQGTLPTPDTSKPSASPWLFFSAAAALFMVCAALLYLLTGQGLTPEQPSTEFVAQVELEHAEDSLRTTEIESLQALMQATGDKSSFAGDHQLRGLRQARQRAASARQHARSRRL